MNETTIPGAENYTVFDVSDRFPIWQTVQMCTMQLKTGAELTAIVAGDDVDIIGWTLRRNFGGATAIIGGSADRETSIEVAREKAQKAMEAWRDLVEYRNNKPTAGG